MSQKSVSKVETVATCSATATQTPYVGFLFRCYPDPKSRCDRDLSGRFKSESYAAEELVAELGAAYLCADLGLASEPRPDHAAYVANWLKVLKDDKRAIFTAAALAQKAADWLHQGQPMGMEAAA